MNEDIFMAPVSCTGHMKNTDSDIQEITEQIHRLLLQVKEDGHLTILCKSLQMFFQFSKVALNKSSSGFLEIFRSFSLDFQL